MHTHNAQNMPWLQWYKGELKWDMDIPERSLCSLFDKAVVERSDKVFLEFLGRHFTYKELDEMVNKMAKGLQKIGVKPKQRVGLLLPNCPHYIVSYLAVLKIGAVVVNCNPLYTLNELKAQINDADISTLITVNLQAIFGKVIHLLQITSLEQIVVAEFQDQLPWLKRKLFPWLRRKDMASVVYSRKYFSLRALMDNDGNYRSTDMDPIQDVAVIQYTGGTTGKSKGAMLTHYNLYANAQQSAAMCSHFEEGKENILAVLPFFHIFAFTAVLQVSLIKNCKIIIHPRFEIDNVIKDIRKHKITILPAVPTMFVAINHYEGKEKRDLRSLRYAISGGAALPASVKETFEEISGGAQIMEGYGLTESSPVASFTPHFGDNVNGSIGIPIPQTIMSITALDNPDKELPQGEIGEVCIEGPQVMLGYWGADRNPEIENPIRNGKLHTGDIGYMDEKGYFYIVDRLKEMIICNGVNVYPRNIEEEALKHSTVKEAAVIGIDDEHKGQVPKLFVALKAGESLSEEELLDFLKKKMASIYQPQIIEFKEELPKTMIGKIDKKALYK